MKTTLLASLLALTLGCTLEVVADNVEGSFTKNVTVEGPVVLEVKSRSGSVEVLGSDGDEVRVHGRIRAGWGLGQKEAEERIRQIESNPPVELRNGVVVVGEGVDPDILENVSVSYEITVPRRAAVTVRSSSGSQTIEDVVGPLKVDASSGSVRIRDVEKEVDVHVSSGSLTVEDLRGSLTAESSSGSQTVRRVAGGVHLRASSGSVKLEEIGGEVDVRSSSGSVRVHQAAAVPVKVDASSGSIRVETAMASGYNFDIRTSSGGIDLPGDSVNLTQDEKRHKQGSLRGGGPLLALNARSGSVEIR